MEIRPRTLFLLLLLVLVLIVTGSMLVYSFLASRSDVAPERSTLLFVPDKSLDFGPAQYVPLSSDWSIAAVLNIAPKIDKAAYQTNLPADLLAALCLISSNCSSSAISPDGAVGLLQIMPRDSRWVADYPELQKAFRERPSTEELKNPVFNLEYGGNMIKKLAQLYAEETPENSKYALQYAVSVFLDGQTELIQKTHDLFTHKK